MPYKYLKFIICLFFLFKTYQSHATHIRAGEILAKKTGSLRYEFTVVLYRDTRGVRMDSVELYFGDNTKQTKFWIEPVENLGNDTEKYLYKFTHDYGAAGVYKVYIFHPNRNDNINNIENSGLVNFYVETQIIIDPFLGQNSSPELRIPPVDLASTNKTFTHNPGAWDADGDSLAFKFTKPKWMVDTAEVVPGYRELTNPAFSVGNCFSTLSIDPIKGDITWNTPCISGTYNIAFVVEEYRNGKLIGFITRDMQIIVDQFENDPPNLKIPNDTCISAGTRLTGKAIATDVAFTQITIYRYGGVFDLNNSPASTAPPSPIAQTTPASMDFSWQTTCAHIRSQPYFVEFKAEDNPSERNKLSTLKTWGITVVAPKPIGLNGTTNNRTINLKWQKYICSNAVKIYIMRKDCPSDSSLTDSCTKGNQATQGFTKIGEVSGSDTTFADNGNLKRGAVYCYRIYAVFPEPAKGLSRASNELCITLSQDVPIIFKVSVDSLTGTDKTNGKINIAWTTPKKIDSTRFPPPYTYELWRKTNNDNLLKVNKVFNFSDTTYTDSGLNTVDNNYNYFVKFFYSPTISFRENTDTASSVKLEGFSRRQIVALRWNYNVPWDNIGKFHQIWRLKDTSFQLIDSVLASSNTVSYTDKGGQNGQTIENGKTYTYFITTKGDYTCPDQVQRVNIPNLLFNNSQRISVTPSDTNRPCPPQLRIFPSACTENSVAPKIHWKPLFEVFCDSAIASYRIYYSPENNNNFSLISTAQARDTLFEHTNGFAGKGCYYITAISIFGLESSPSNTVCSVIDVERCAFLDFQLPNVFTPNGDDVNDEFKPKRTPSLVNNVEIKVYNRWGIKVFESNEINFSWDGNQATDGLYYYIARVKFNTQNGLEKDFKGWVQLIR